LYDAAVLYNTYVHKGAHYENFIVQLFDCITAFEFILFHV
jgi:hypothetical protein